MRGLRAELGGVPIVHAGDVFDKWNTPVEFVNLIIEHMPPDVYAVPGQHDLPNHRYEDVGRSAYYNLVKASVISDVTPERSIVVGSRPEGLIELFGFPWGSPPSPCPVKALVGGGRRLRLAVVHRYVWARPEDNPARRDDEARVNVIGRAFDGYDAVVIGDNHTPWQLNGSGGPNCVPVVFNHGTALRRHADEKGLIVGPGVLYDDGTVGRVELRTAPDVWAESFERAAGVEKVGVDARALLALLRAGGEAVVSFRRAARVLAESPDISPGVRAALQEWVG